MELCLVPHEEMGTEGAGEEEKGEGREGWWKDKRDRKDMKKTQRQERQYRETKNQTETQADAERVGSG